MMLKIFKQRANFFSALGILKVTLLQNANPLVSAAADASAQHKRKWRGRRRL